MVGFPAQPAGTVVLFGLFGFNPAVDDLRFEGVRLASSLPADAELEGIWAVSTREAGSLRLTDVRFPPSYPLHPIDDLRLSADEPQSWYVAVGVRLGESVDWGVTGIEVQWRAGGQRGVTHVPRAFVVMGAKDSSEILVTDGERWHRA